ncbi:MAG: hypothetical protein ABI867_14520 [Kofleriaceae bacterium]
MSNQGPKKKILKLSSETLARLTPGELQGAVGGITGVTDGASNQTGFDTNGAKLSVQWYLQKFTLRCR